VFNTSLSLILCLTFALTATTALAETEEKLLYLGKDAITKNNQKKAVHYLLPLAKKGNTEAQYYLGALFVEAKNIKNNKHFARRLLNASANQGHKQAFLLLLQLDASEKAAESSKRLSIVKKGLPSNNQIAEIRKVEKKLNEKHTPIINPAFRVDIFVSNASKDLKSIIDHAENFKKLHPNKITFNYHLKINEVSPYHTIDAQSHQIRIPPEGFNPDINGVLAKKYGVTLFPGIDNPIPINKQIKTPGINFK
jgi:hypothetical protein